MGEHELTYLEYIDIFLETKGKTDAELSYIESEKLINYISKFLKGSHSSQGSFYYWLMYYYNCVLIRRIDDKEFPLMKQFADDSNDPKLLFYVGMCYENGLGVKNDSNTAIQYFKKSAESGYADAQYLLGAFYGDDSHRGKYIHLSLEWYLKAALNGHVESQYSLGNLYSIGKGIEHSNEEAFKWYLEAAVQGHADSQVKVGEFYFQGIVVNKDTKEAMEWFKKAASQRNASACYYIGASYIHGELGDRDYKKAVPYLLIAADQREPKACLYLGRLFEHGWGVDVDYSKAVYYYQIAALNRNAEAQCALAMAYQLGRGVEKDPKKAIALYKIAADNGFMIAQYNLGLMYVRGVDTEQNIQKGIEYLKLAALQDDVQSQTELGNIYISGKYIDQNKDEAFKWYLMAAKNGELSAIYNVGYIYLQRGDYQNAVKYLEHAAEQGAVLAQYNLGCLYCEGGKSYSGVEINLPRAFHLFSLAAAQGMDNAKYNLALCYERGVGTEVNLEKALELYQDAALSGDAMAKNAVERVLNLIRTIEEQEYADIVHNNDVFISWNHHNKETKDNIAKYLRNHNIKVWESDSSGSGEISKQCKLGIKYSRVYLILLSKESIQSTWVKKEIALILEKEKYASNLSELIRPIYIDDVTKEISEFEDSNPFKIISNLSSNFGVKEEEILSIVKEMLSKSCIESYNTKLYNQSQEFNLFMSEDLKDDEKGSIISTLVKYSEGYIERKLIKDNQEYEDSEVLKKERILAIVAPGGTGKSLFLKNLIRKYNVLNKENNTLCFDYFFLFSFSELVKYYKEKKGSLEQYIFDYLKDYDEDNTRRLDKLYLQDKKVVVLIDALDEAGGDKEVLKEISKVLKDYCNSHQGSKIIITTRNMQNVDDYLNSVPQYTLSKLSDEDIHTIIERLFNEFRVKIFDKEKYSPNLNSFYASLEEEIYKDIKVNPLLLVNLAIIYFLKRKMPRSEYEIIDQASKIIINDVENKVEIGINCQDLMKITNELLGYISFARYIGSKETSKELINDYLEYKGIGINNKEQQIEDYIYYLKVRSILVNDNLYHNMFRSYFSAKYLFELLYIKKSIPIKYYQFASNGESILEQYNKEYFKDISPWIEILSSLITRLDYSIYNLLGREIDGNNSNYDILNKTLRILHLPIDNRSNLYDQTLKLCRYKSFYNYVLIREILEGIKGVTSNRKVLDSKNMNRY